MTIKTTRWQPDTCACTMEYSWDDSVPDDSRVHTPVSISKCQYHQSLSNADAHTHAAEQNRRRNLVLTEALTRFTALQDTDPDSGAIILKKSIRFNWSFSGTADTRVLTVSFSGITLTTNQKNTLQTALDTRFGAGKVVVQ